MSRAVESATIINVLGGRMITGHRACLRSIEALLITQVHAKRDNIFTLMPYQYDLHGHTTTYLTAFR